MASKKLILTCYLAFLGFAFAEIMPKDFVSKMQIVENEAKALMHMEPKRGSDDFVSTIKQLIISLETSNHFPLQG